MKRFAINLAILILGVALSADAAAQSGASAEEKERAQLELLTKKIEEQNTKIDALSQQILKLEQQISAIRPGVMIGETTPSSAPPASAASAAPTAGGNAHTVAKGETLTSIAKTYKVGVQELQKFNHIENDRALQIGQTIQIPTAGSSSPASSPSPTTP
ncbi:MAG: LysM peptidoglycan-binding domain-containing protein [Chthoniobacterales bacterium]